MSEIEIKINKQIKLTAVERLINIENEHFVNDTKKIMYDDSIDSEEKTKIIEKMKQEHLLFLEKMNSQLIEVTYDLEKEDDIELKTNPTVKKANKIIYPITVIALLLTATIGLYSGKKDRISKKALEKMENYTKQIETTDFENINYKELINIITNSENPDLALLSIYYVYGENAKIVAQNICKNLKFDYKGTTFSGTFKDYTLLNGYESEDEYFSDSLKELIKDEDDVLDNIKVKIKKLK